MNRARRPGHGTERGAALLIAVAALSLVAILGAVLLANAQADIHRAERIVDRTEGDQLMEIAVAAAWGEIVSGATRGFSEDGRAESGEWSVRATPAEDRWVLEVEATTDGDVVQGLITVSRDPLLPYTLIVGDATTGPLSGAVDGRIAIRGDARFSGRPLGDVQELIGADASCVGCDNPVEIGAGATTIPLPVLPAAACPDVDGTITGALVGGFAYQCTTPGVIVLDGTITTDGPVVLSFGAEVEARLENADINPGGDPIGITIHSDSASSSAVHIIASELNGLLTVPDGRLSTDGFRWTGTVEAAELRTATGSELHGSWSEDLESLGFAGWRITGWDTRRS